MKVVEEGGKLLPTLCEEPWSPQKTSTAPEYLYSGQGSSLPSPETEGDPSHHVVETNPQCHTGDIPTPDQRQEEQGPTTMRS